MKGYSVRLEDKEDGRDFRNGISYSFNGNLGSFEFIEIAQPHFRFEDTMVTGAILKLPVC